MPSRTIRRVGSAAIERRRAKINAEIAAESVKSSETVWVS